MDLIKQVVDKTGSIGMIVGINIKKGSGVPFEVSLDEFNKQY